MKKYSSVIFILLCVFIINVEGQDAIPQTLVLDFEGNRVFSKKELLDVANNCLAELPKSPGEQSETLLTACLRRVRLFMLGKGYLQAEISEPRRELSGEGSKTIVAISEGILYRVGKIEITGSKLFSPHQLRDLMNVKTGDIATADNVVAGLYTRVKKAYSNLGYIEYTAEILPRFYVPAGSQEGVVDFTLNIDEGEMFTIGSIRFEGNKDVSEGFLQREMLVHVGDVFAEDLFNNSLTIISGIGQFEEINAIRDVKYKVDNKTKRIDLTIRLTSKAGVPRNCP